MSGYHKKRTPPGRFCPDCGVYVGRHFQDYVLCRPCKEDALARATARTAERNRRHNRAATQPTLLDDLGLPEGY